MLIRSLDQTEKRYFTVYAKRHAIGGKNIYLTLFEAIAKGEAVDGDKIVPKEQLASHKHYLFQMILKAMRGYNSGKDVENEMREILSDIHFLESKRMFPPCLKLIRKGQRLGELHDRFTELLSLLDIERRLVKLMQPDKLLQEMDRLEHVRKDIIDRMTVHYAYIELYDRLFATLRKQLRNDRQTTVQYIQELLAGPLLSNPNLPSSFHSKSYYLLGNAFCYQLLEQYSQSKKFHVENIELWDQNPHRIKSQPYQHQRALSNYLGACQMDDDFSAYPRILAMMKDFEGTTVEERAEHFTNYHFYSFNYHMNVWQFEEAVAFAPEIDLGLQKYGAIIPDSRRLVFIYNLMVMFFFLNKPKESLKWLLKLTNGEKSEVRQDAQRAARLFLLVLHYQLGNLDLYDHLFPSVQRYLSQKGINEFEQKLLEFLKVLYRTDGSSWPRPAAEALVTSLEALSKANSDAHFPGIREVIIWLKAK
ncbi:MAG: hypothetical protein KA239_09770, partial [Bacteroidia bacterium]|nr:hypothetical protein [Bacteroidia bacterium]